jgi:predicted transcriptional regulator
MKRVNVSLPDDLVADIDAVASAMGSSRSAALSGILKQTDFRALADLIHMASAAEASDDPQASRRFRGESAQLILKELQKAMNAQGGLFDDTHG